MAAPQPNVLKRARMHKYVPSITIVDESRQLENQSKMARVEEVDKTFISTQTTKVYAEKREPNADERRRSKRLEFIIKEKDGRWWGPAETKLKTRLRIRPNQQNIVITPPANHLPARRVDGADRQPTLGARFVNNLGHVFIKQILWKPNNQNDVEDGMTDLALKEKLSYYHNTTAEEKQRFEQRRMQLDYHHLLASPYAEACSFTVTPPGTIPTELLAVTNAIAQRRACHEENQDGWITLVTSVPGSWWQMDPVQMISGLITGEMELVLHADSTLIISRVCTANGFGDTPAANSLRYEVDVDNTFLEITYYDVHQSYRDALEQKFFSKENNTFITLTQTMLAKSHERISHANYGDKGFLFTIKEVDNQIKSPQILSLHTPGATS